MYQERSLSTVSRLMELSQENVADMTNACSLVCLTVRLSTCNNSRCSWNCWKPDCPSIHMQQLQMFMKLLIMDAEADNGCWEDLIKSPNAFQFSHNRARVSVSLQDYYALLWASCDELAKCLSERNTFRTKVEDKMQHILCWIHFFVSSQTNRKNCYIPTNRQVYQKGSRHVRELPASNLGRDTGYLVWIIIGFPPPFQINAGIVSRFDHNCFIPHPL
jgi:hypothetical protein